MNQAMKSYLSGDKVDVMQIKHIIQKLTFLLVTCFSITTRMAQAGISIPSASATRNIFAADIFQKVAVGKAENVIFSPASIQTCLALAFFAADNETAEEFRTVLKFGNAGRDDIAKNFEEFVHDSFKSSKDDNAIQLRMANRIFINENLEINQDFNKIAEKAFKSRAEQLKFADSTNAINRINSFVEEQTQNKIKNLLQPGAVDANTSLVLINAIYFKGKWKIPFSADLTHKSDFAVEGIRKVPVDTMHMTEWLQYGEFPELDAKVVELPYNNSELSMMFLLPNNADGLKNLEEKLANKDLNEISSQLQRYEVATYIPKFRIEYDLDLKAPLQALGLKAMFTDAADFGGLLQCHVNQKVSQVKHKAFIDVNEAGSEAAAATFMKMVPMSLNLDEKEFRANHPFCFAIRDLKAVYFAGHVVKF